MQVIAVDTGNSSTKIAVQDSSDADSWILQLVFGRNEPIQIDLSGVSTPAFWSVSSVNQSRTESLHEWVSRNRPEDEFYIISSSDVGISTDVQSREQLGRDRLVAAWTAVELNEAPGPTIIVDAGTAVTIDYVDEKGVFQGGVIFPGAELNFRQLAKHTDALPDLRGTRQLKFDRTDVIGKSTEDAIRKGVFHLQLSAIENVIKQMNGLDGQQATVFLTGGGITEITSILPSHYRFVPDLVLRGAKLIGDRLLDIRLTADESKSNR